jgi:YVTN family beta-propeller protein
LALSGLVVGVAGASGDPLAYVTNEQAGTISQVDLTTGTVGAPIHVGSEPYALAITPDGSTAYVADYGSSEIVPVALATGTVETPIVLNDRPNAIGITPNGKTAYVIADTGREWPIRLSNRQVGNPTQIPANADSVAITPNGNTAYITDVATGTMEPFSLLNGALGQTINLPVSTPDGIAITSDGSTAYVASNSGGTITPVTLATGTSGTAIPAGPEPSAVAISTDGSTAYVTNFNTGQITPITLATATDGTPIDVGPDPSAIALVPASGITTAPNAGGSGPGGGSGTGGGANSGSVGNQQLTLTVSGGSSGSSGSSATAQSCRAPGSTVSVGMTRKTLPHGAKLTLRYVTFALGKQLKKVKRLPATVKLSLRGLRPGVNTITVRAYYSEKLAASARKRRKLTVTISKTLKTRITVC